MLDTAPLLHPTPDHVHASSTPPQPLLAVQLLPPVASSATRHVGGCACACQLTYLCTTGTATRKPPPAWPGQLTHTRPVRAHTHGTTVPPPTARRGKYPAHSACLGSLARSNAALRHGDVHNAINAARSPAVTAAAACIASRVTVTTTSSGAVAPAVIVAVCGCQQRRVCTMTRLVSAMAGGHTT